MNYTTKRDCPISSMFGINCPGRRYGHAAVCLGYGTDNPQIFVTGGRDNRGVILNDAWILDVRNSVWSEVSDACSMN